MPLNQRQRSIVLFALNYLRSNLEPEVEDMLTNGIGESGGSLSIEKEIDNTEEIVGALVIEPEPENPSPVLTGQCEMCGKQAALHKVKYEDDTSIGSMNVCEQCDE